eukprot:UC4_evm1s507
MKYQKGDYVLIEPSVLDQKFKQASGPSIVCITCNNGGNLEAFLFYRPDQIFCQANKTFYEREVLFSNDKIKCSVDDVVGRCHVLAHRDYHAGLGVEDVPEEQVYICVSRYSAATKSISTIRRGHKQLRDFCLVPKTKDKRSMTKHKITQWKSSDDSSSFSEDEDEESGEDIHDDDNRDDSENVDIDGEDLEQRNQSSNLNSLPSSGSDDDNCDDTETYFADHKSSKIMSTSDHTLAKMDFSRIDGATIRSVKLKLDERTIRARNEMMMTNYSHFDLWNYQLKTGYNLLFYGFGTKKNLIMDFATKKLQNSTRLVINGYFPSLTIKEILLQITQKMFGFESSFLRISEHLEFIEEIFRDDNLNPSINGPINNKELYLLINNIDGAMLRDPVSQNVFRTLAKIPQIHLVASIDHINATLIWDQGQLSDFNWLCTDHKLMIMKKRDGMEFFKLDLDSAFLEALEEMMIKEFENEEPSRI